MCGFVAVLSRPGSACDKAAIAGALETLTHRGPDDRACFADEALTLGFRRLSIFDLTTSARQPMLSRDGRYVIAFNGAIYNWPELRSQLEAKGHVFSTHGDAEVLLSAWMEWGSACLHRLNGMFAFLIWDRTERRLFGARDRFGVKPMFWSDVGGSIQFASEIKALVAIPGGTHAYAVDWDTVADFLANDRLDARDETFFAGVRRVPAGTCFVAEPGGPIRWTRWWSLDSAVAASPEVAAPAEEFAEIFEDAVRLRMRGDVPVGVLLSGGLDSTSIICAMARTREAFSGRVPQAFGYISPDSAHDESAALAATLQQTGAHFERMSPAAMDLFGDLERHLWFQDEPVYSFSSLVAEHLVGASRRSGVKVLLNGQGADEVLGGYPNYFSLYWAQLLCTGRVGAAVASMRSFARTQRGQVGRYIRDSLRHATLHSINAIPGVSRLMAGRRRTAPAGDWIVPDLRARAVPLRPAPPFTLEGALRNSLESSDLPVYLRQEDRNGMAHGVEARLPFLDHRLVTLAFSLGDSWKLSGPYGKHLLREAMRGRIPDAVRTDARKLGFPTPIDEWFRGPLREPMSDMLNSREFRESGLWKPAIVQHAFQQHLAGRASCGARLFDVAQTLTWLRSAGAGARYGMRASPS